MELVIVPKADLSVEQLRHLEERLRAPEHAMDRGPIMVWGTYPRGLYGVVDRGSGLPIGIIESSGPLDHMGAGWWLDSRFRGRGFGNETVDALAIYLRSLGVTGIGRIVIDTFGGQYTAASSKLAIRLRAHFPAGEHDRRGVGADPADRKDDCLTCCGIVRYEMAGRDAQITR